MCAKNSTFATGAPQKQNKKTITNMSESASSNSNSNSNSVLQDNVDESNGLSNSSSPVARLRSNSASITAAGLRSIFAEQQVCDLVHVCYVLEKFEKANMKETVLQLQSCKKEI